MKKIRIVFELKFKQLTLTLLENVVESLLGHFILSDRFFFFNLTRKPSTILRQGIYFFIYKTNSIVK